MTDTSGATARDAGGTPSAVDRHRPSGWRQGWRGLDPWSTTARAALIVAMLLASPGPLRSADEAQTARALKVKRDVQDGRPGRHALPPAEGPSMAPHCAGCHGSEDAGRVAPGRGRGQALMI